jgi:hypothetical protein
MISGVMPHSLCSDRWMVLRDESSLILHNGALEAVMRLQCFRFVPRFKRCRTLELADGTGTIHGCENLILWSLNIIILSYDNL